MKCIVPLAGPDLYDPILGFRPLHDLNGRPLLEVALNQRPWRGKLQSSDFLFVIREAGPIEMLMAYLERTWPDCVIVRLPRLTGGAMFSVLAAVSFIGPDEAVIVDLADILFDAALDDPATLLGGEVGAVVPCFASDEACYSYLREKDGRVVEAAEKRVISRKASAGVYIFADVQTLLRAAAHSLDNASDLAFKGLLFVCPMVNGVLAEGRRVLAPEVALTGAVGKLFHQDEGRDLA